MNKEKSILKKTDLNKIIDMKQTWLTIMCGQCLPPLQQQRQKHKEMMHGNFSTAVVRHQVKV